ncbi:hypothetical protein EYF80_016967 [Liparis tanakae]|uniref:Uncharacterized protein n=1 Tax=Liparis tanakae TaxID=230148 RepID=A0A4Z2I454_9TELE|nr:hypothetical protein EYF80_016967 [Liparis tanakae]
MSVCYRGKRSGHAVPVLPDAIDKGDNRRLGKKPVFTSSQSRAVKCPSSAPESPPVLRTQRVSENAASASRGAAAAMKSDGPGAATKPAEGHAAKAKKPGERSAAGKAKAPSAGAPVVNGTGAAGARRDAAGANGPRSSSHGAREPEKKTNPGARPKTSPPSYTSTSQTGAMRAQKSSAGKAEGSVGSGKAQASTSSTSGSASPENGASSPRNDAHSIPGAKPRHQAKAVTKSPLTKPPQKSDAAKISSVRESAKVKTGAAEKAAAAAKADAKGRGPPDHHVSKHGSSVKKPSSPRREDGKDGLKSSAADRAAGDAHKKKIAKPAAAIGASVKSGAKPPKASQSPSKQSAAAAAKSGPKPKSATDSSAEKASPKASSRTSASSASKKPGTKGKEAVNGQSSDGQSEPTENAGDAAAHTGSPEVALSDQTSSQGGGDSLRLKLEASPKQSPRKSEARNATSSPAAHKPPHGKGGAADARRQADGGKARRPPGGGVLPAHVGGVREAGAPNSSPRDAERPPAAGTPCSTGEDSSWSGGGHHHQVSPESETGSTHTTSSDDIKPRSEDYDAGGSQDDDGSNDRGVSKCGTMRCHDFLGRSSSDTSTPEELKMCDGGGGLRVEVRLRGREAETTSEEEAVLRQHPRSWLHRDEEEERSEVEASGRSVPDPQLFSSEEEDEDEEEEEATEDERSEVEVIPGPPPPPAEPSPPFQGIVNLAFDDDAADAAAAHRDGEPQPDYQSASGFRRSVLLSVDECEELGSEEGGVQTPPPRPDDGATPCDVFDADPPPEGEKSAVLFLAEIREPARAEADGADARELPPQERPRHLDLRHAEQYDGGPRRNHGNASESKKADLHLDLNEPQLTGDSPVNDAQSPAGNV